MRPQNINECKNMTCHPWSYHGVVLHYVHILGICILLTMTCKKMRETNTTCIVHMCLLCKIPPMHEQWDHVVRVEEATYLRGINLQCIHMSDEEPWVFQQFPDQK